MPDFDNTTPFFYDVPHDLDYEECWCCPDVEVLKNGAVLIAHLQGVC